MNLLVKHCQIVSRCHSIFTITAADPGHAPQPTDLEKDATFVSFLDRLGLLRPVTPNHIWLNEFDLILSDTEPEPGDRLTVRCNNIDYGICEVEKNEHLGCGLTLSAWLYDVLSKEPGSQDLYLTIEPCVRAVGGDQVGFQEILFMLATYWEVRLDTGKGKGPECVYAYRRTRAAAMLAGEHARDTILGCVGFSVKEVPQKMKPGWPPPALESMLN